MKAIPNWSRFLTLTFVTVLAWESLMLPGRGQNFDADLQAQMEDQIPIYVPPPERNVSGVCSFLAEPAIDSILNRPAFRGGRWGILLQTLNGQVIYSHNADQSLIPASNTKLMTTASALQVLSPGTTIRGTSLADWIRTTNVMSNNGYAEVLFRTIGGASVTRSALIRLGVNPNSFRQVDGSGLSRGNRATPRALVQILRGMASANGREVFIGSLPLAGVSGTLRNRFRGTSAQGRIRAKTGTLTGVRALSGYIDHPQFGTLLFSILANHGGTSGQTLVRGVDEIALVFVQLIDCR